MCVMLEVCLEQITGVQHRAWLEVMLYKTGELVHLLLLERKEVINAGHGVEDAPNIIYTRGVVLNDGEGQMLGLVITIKDGYIGPHFVHRLTPTNITSKLMKIPNKIAQLLNLDPEGVVGLCTGVGEVTQVGYYIDPDGRMVFDKDWGVFATQNHLQVGDAVCVQLQAEQCTGHQHNMRRQWFEGGTSIRFLVLETVC